MGALESRWHFGATIIRGQIIAAQGKLALAIGVQGTLKIAVGGLYDKVVTCRANLEAALEGGADALGGIAGGVAMAGIKAAELAANTALGAAELALAAPK